MGEEARIGENGGGGHAGTRDPTGCVRGENGCVRGENGATSAISVSRSPAAWPYQPGEKTMTRFDATAMNRLCQWLVGEDAAEINYHGMKPENIDALARAAAKVEAL